jgi:hypothetical protein
MDCGRWNETTSFGRFERTRIETAIPSTQTIVALAVSKVLVMSFDIPSWAASMADEVRRRALSRRRYKSHSGDTTHQRFRFH